MAKVVHLQSRRQIQEVASDWVSRLDRGLNNVERGELEAWLQADPRHVATFVDCAKTWDKLEELTALSGLVELPSPQSSRSKIRRSRAAAAMALVSVAATIGLWMGFSTTLPNPITALSQFVPTTRGIGTPSSKWSSALATSTGETKKTTLPDGSMIELNTRSALDVTLDANERRINLLAGEATFNVASDPSRPFIVQAAGRRIRAVGTVFTVMAKSQDHVSVLVSEGRVAVSPAPRTRVGTPPATPDAESPIRILETGDRLEMVGVSAQIRKLSPSDIGDALAWQKGMIVFQGESLLEALGEVSRYSDARFEVTDESIGETQIAGVYRVKDLKGFVDSLRVNLGIGAKRLPDGTLSLYRIRSAEPHEGPPNS